MARVWRTVWHIGDVVEGSVWLLAAVADDRFGEGRANSRRMGRLAHLTLPKVRSARTDAFRVERKLPRKVRLRGDDSF